MSDSGGSIRVMTITGLWLRRSHALWTVVIIVSLLVAANVSHAQLATGASLPPAQAGSGGTMATSASAMVTYRTADRAWRRGVGAAGRLAGYAGLVREGRQVGFAR